MINEEELAKIQKIIDIINSKLEQGCFISDYSSDKIIGYTILDGNVFEIASSGNFTKYLHLYDLEKAEDFINYFEDLYIIPNKGILNVRRFIIGEIG